MPQPSVKYYSQGITYLELLLVIAVMIMLGASAAPFYSNFILYNNFDTANRRVIGMFRKAQAYAMDEKLGQTWGVCVTGGELRLYSNSCAAPNFNENYPLPANVSITGFSDISFTKSGQPSGVATVIVSSPLETSTITINSAGRINL